MRTCSKCLVDKAATAEFFYKTKSRRDGLTAECRACARKRFRTVIALNPEKNREKVRAWRLANPERARAKVAELHRQRREQYRPAKVASQHRCRDRIRRYERERWASDIAYRVSKVMAHRMRQAIKGKKSGRKWEGLTGYGIDDLIGHLERQFTRAMSWENYGLVWEIDHVLPIAMFKGLPPDEAFRICWALTNLRPLLSGENARKGASRTLLL